MNGATNNISCNSSQPEQGMTLAQPDTPPRRNKQPVKRPPLGECLYHVRMLEGLNRNAFATKYGFSSNFVGMVEDGLKETTNKTIYRLIDIFGRELFGKFIEKRECQQCGKPFEPWTKEKFCCHEHSLIFNKNSALEKYEQVKKARSNKRRDRLSPLARDNEDARKMGLSYGMFRVKMKGWI